ncbi:hypothetical protein DYB25_011270, partial [Aphanomyces astaci]
LLPIAKVTLHQASIVPLKLKQTVAGLSKSVLNHPLLETQEAKNVTHGLLGQGSLVLPTAAFSAAYSVGSVPAVDRIMPDVSPEFTGGVALFRHHLVFAHASLNPSSFEVYWKALSKELDGHVLAIVLQLKVLTSSTYELVEASAVLHMPTAKAKVLGDALATQHKLDMASIQIQTMLEASQLHALTPSNVFTLLRMGA